MSDFLLRERGIVSISENKPFHGRVTIYYTPPEGYISRSMELPMTAFLAACRQLADRMAGPPLTKIEPQPQPESKPKPLIRRLAKTAQA